MKKIYALASMLVLAGSVSAQRTSADAKYNFHGLENAQEAPRAAAGVSEGSTSGSQWNGDRTAVYWSETFGNGFAGDASNGTWTTAGLDGGIWDWVPSLDNGCYSTNSADPTFATVANGFMVFHGDSANCTNPGPPPAATANQWEGKLVSPTIDLTGTTDVSIHVETEYRFCCVAGQLLLRVSGDGGGTFTEYNLAATTPVNAASAAPQAVDLNISSIVAGSNQVVLEFQWTGGISHYYWAVDDIILFRSPQNELEFIASNYGNETPEPIWGEHLPYTVVPDEQVEDIIFFGELVNQGRTDEAGTMFTADVMDAGMATTYSGMGAGVTLMAEDTLRDTVTVAWTPPASGGFANITAYTFDYGFDYGNIGNDSITTNNTQPGAGIEYTASEYGRDLTGFTTAGLWNSDDDNGSGNGNAYGFIMGQEFEIKQTTFLTDVRVAFDDNTVAGAIVYPYIIEIDLSAASFQDLFVNVIYDGSAVALGEYTIQPADVPGGSTVWTDLPLASPVTLNAGSTYMIGFGTYGGPEGVRVMEGGVNPPDATVFLYDAAGWQQGQPQWFWVDDTPKIRAVVVQNLNVPEEELSFSLEQNQPNPFNDNAIVRYNLKESGDVRFEVIDVTGKVVASEYVGKQAAGNYNFEINGADLNSGVYYYTLYVNDQKITKKMMVTK